MRKTIGFLLLSLILAGLVAALIWILLVRSGAGPGDDLAAFSLDERPHQDRALFDYAGVLSHYEEGANRYLDRLATRFQIEALIVSLPALPDGQSTETLAVDLVNRWRIGADQAGRGLLLLLVDDVKEVKLEVGYALEDVFTDAFSGYVGDLQLGPYFRAGDTGTGLIAVMEMLEERAQLKALGETDPARLATLDAELIAGGAGATRALEQYGTEPGREPAVRGTGGARSPEEAWEMMLAKWSGTGADRDVEVYTEMTRLAMGDADRPPGQTLAWLEHWRNADYQVLRRGNHAVIWFGAIDGWENSPFLFCDPGDGWKFDVVWQRRLVVMGEAPTWQVMQGPFPYVALMDQARQSTGKDLPLGEGDLYRCEDDAAIAARMAALQAGLKADPNDAAATLELLRLLVITDQAPGQVRPLIDRARQLAPDHPDPWKYSAIYNINSVFQYQTALGEMDHYIALRPDDPFGYRMRGFIQYRLADYADSITTLELAVALDANDDYAYALMARNYRLLARRASGMRREGYLEQALAMRELAAGVSTRDQQRLEWLDTWLAQLR